MNAYAIQHLANTRYEDFEREAAHDRLVREARAARPASDPRSPDATRTDGPVGAAVACIRSNPRISRLVAAVTAG